MLIVSQGAQSIAFGAAPAVNEGGTGLVLFTSNQAITTGRFSSNITTICTASGVNNSTATGVAAGICSRTASEPTNANYLAATATLSFGVGAAPMVCNLRMNGTNPMLATVEGLILTRAMPGSVCDAVTAGTSITAPWNTLRDALNLKCGASCQ